MKTLQKLHEMFSEELIFLQDNISEKGNESIHTQIISHLINNKGKKIRFLLVVLIGRIINNDDSKNLDIMNAATAVEIIHNATLIHDDIIDESDFRHGLETAHKIWGNKISILIGDYLFMQALLCVTKTRHMSLIDAVAHSTREIIDGEITNLHAKIMINDNEKYQNYMKWIDSKTATLFALATQIPAILFDKNHDEIAQWHELGQKIGIGFQIIDDVMDYTNIDKFGKEKGRDFFNGQITLPTLLCMQNANDNEMYFWHRTLEEKNFQTNDWDKCLDLLSKYDAINKARKMIQENFDIAYSILNKMKIKYEKNHELISMIENLIQDLLSRIN